MHSKRNTIVSFIIFAASLAMIYFVYTALTKDYQPHEQTDQIEESTRQTAPDFTVIDASGHEVKLSDFKGEPIVLNFWASWCPPCKSEMPHFDQVYSELKDDVVFMMVDLVDGHQETVATGQKYIADQSYNFPVYYDNQQNAAYTYSIRSIPTTFFIDPEGYLITAYQGPLSEKELRAAIELITPEQQDEK